MFLFLFIFLLSISIYYNYLLSIIIIYYLSISITIFIYLYFLFIYSIFRTYCVIVIEKETCSGICFDMPRRLNLLWYLEFLRDFFHIFLRMGPNDIHKSSYMFLTTFIVVFWLIFTAFSIF